VDPRKVEAIATWSVPKSVEALRGFGQTQVDYLGHVETVPVLNFFIIMIVTVYP